MVVSKRLLVLVVLGSCIQAPLWRNPFDYGGSLGDCIVPDFFLSLRKQSDYFAEPTESRLLFTGQVEERPLHGFDIHKQVDNLDPTYF